MLDKCLAQILGIARSAQYLSEFVHDSPFAFGPNSPAGGIREKLPMERGKGGIALELISKIAHIL
tara:strand:- start:697 stop:891 length:195 start_codon:yes stop_codon:yes gene_type:complete